MLAGVFFSLSPNSVGDFEVVMDYATKSGCLAGTWKLLRRRFADWANEGHSLDAVAGHAGASLLRREFP